MNKAERLAVAGSNAPLLREVADKLAKRVVYTYDQETGETRRVLSGARTLEGIHALVGVEFSIVPAVGATPPCKRCGLPSSTDRSSRHQLCPACRSAKCIDCGGPKTNEVGVARCSDCSLRTRRKPPIACSKCNADLPRKERYRHTRNVKEHGPRAAVCGSCKAPPEPKTAPCRTCGGPTAQYSMSPGRVRARAGAPPECRGCSARKTAELARQAAAALPPQRRSVCKAGLHPLEGENLSGRSCRACKVLRSRMKRRSLSNTGGTEEAK